MTMEFFQLIKASERDISIIRQIAMAAWPVAYCSILSSGQLEYMLSSIYSENKLYEQVHNGEQEFIIAYQNGQPIAFAGFGITNKDPLMYKLHKLYVLPTVQKTGAGRRLLQEIEAISINAGATQLILNVNRANAAINFYERQGFSIIESVDISIGQGFWMNDYVMGKTLHNRS